LSLWISTVLKNKNKLYINEDNSLEVEKMFDDLLFLMKKSGFNSKKCWEFFFDGYMLNIFFNRKNKDIDTDSFHKKMFFKMIDKFGNPPINSFLSVPDANILNIKIKDLMLLDQKDIIYKKTCLNQKNIDYFYPFQNEINILVEKTSILNEIECNQKKGLIVRSKLKI
jgi:hypothetical protein